MWTARCLGVCGCDLVGDQNGRWAPRKVCDWCVRVRGGVEAPKQPVGAKS